MRKGFVAVGYTLCMLNIFFVQTSFAAHESILRPVKQELAYQFSIPQFRSVRQGGQIINVFVKYGLKDKTRRQDYPNLREVRDAVIELLQPSSSIPENESWEFVAQAVGFELYHRFHFKGVSVQFVLFPNDTGSVANPGLSEPTSHGPIFTVGRVQPLAVPPPI